LELLVGEPHVLVLGELVALDEPRAFHDFVADGAELLHLDAVTALRVQEVEGDAASRGRRVHLHRDGHQPERDRSRADRMRWHDHDPPSRRRYDRNDTMIPPRAPGERRKARGRTSEGWWSSSTRRTSGCDRGARAPARRVSEKARSGSDAGAVRRPPAGGREGVRRPKARRAAGGPQTGGPGW